MICEMKMEFTSIQKYFDLFSLFVSIVPITRKLSSYEMTAESAPVPGNIKFRVEIKKNAINMYVFIRKLMLAALHAQPIEII